jgi:3-methyladenine DNA glycosylase Tag
VRNAQAYLHLVQQAGSFSDWLWAFVEHTPQLPPHPLTRENLRSVSPEAKAMSKDQASTTCHGEVTPTCVKDHAQSVARVS